MPSAVKVHILQNSDGKILAVETSLKKLADIHGDTYDFLSYQHLNRLSKTARDNGSNYFTFKGKKEPREEYYISWWDI